MMAAASMVIPDLPAADIGTDHGFIPAYLLAEGICPHAVLTDINEGPLEKCRANLKELGIDPSLYTIRKGDGFEALEPEESASVIIAGMGGELIISMFEHAPYELSCFKRIILQPRTHADELRSFLTQSGFKICAYKLARERGRICEVFAVEPCQAGSCAADSALVSSYLLEHGDPLLKEFIDKKIEHTKYIIKQTENSSSRESAQQRTLFEGILKQLNEIRSGL